MNKYFELKARFDEVVVKNQKNEEVRQRLRGLLTGLNHDDVQDIRSSEEKTEECL